MAPKRKHQATKEREREQVHSRSRTAAERHQPTRKAKKQKKADPAASPSANWTSIPEPCRFLELPAEIRNLIYEKVLEDYPAYLHPHNRGRLVCASKLLGTNHQIRSEFLSELYLTAPIFAQVYDWNFNHIVSFLNRLSTSELKSLPRSIYRPNLETKVVGREMTVELVLGSLSRDEQNLLRDPSLQALDRAPNLEKWIRRMGQKDKRRLTADVRYKVTCAGADRFKNLVTLRCWETYLGDLRAGFGEGPSRARAELTTIRVAVLEENKVTLEQILNTLQHR